MKKTLTINLNRTVYHIDEDAYDKLKTYLEELHARLDKGESAAEILSDIEGRIAELFDERKKYGSLEVMTIREVEEIITIMGSPQDIGSEEESTSSPNENDGTCEGKTEEDTDKTQQETSGENEQKKIRRRLYRNPDNKVIGGVCGGLGEFFNTDPLLFRIIFILPFFWGATIWAYLILWIVIPSANTVARKLEMRGVEPTAENIRRFIQGEAADEAGQNGTQAKKKSIIEVILGFIGEVIRLIVKLILTLAGGALGCLGLIILFCVVVSIAAVIGAGLNEPVFPGSGLFWQYYCALGALNMILVALGILLAIGIPVFILVFTLLQRLLGWKRLTRTVGWILFALWIVGLILTVVLSVTIMQDIWTMGLLESHSRTIHLNL